MENVKSRKVIWFLAIGFLIDFYDMSLFVVVRESILGSLGVNESDFMRVGALMINAQALGLVCGGILSGIWSDKFGRMSAVRFGILLYSAAIISNIFVTNITLFAILRFICAVGLAGELAVSVTLLSEFLPSEKRAYASGIVYSAGVLGGVLAVFIGSLFHWKAVFFIGGFAGFCLLIHRIRFQESILFINTNKNNEVSRGSLKLLFSNKLSVLKILALTLVLLPFWFFVFFINFAPEVAKAIGVKEVISQKISLAFYYLGLFTGSYFYSFLANFLKSRKKSIFVSAFLMIFIVTSLKFGSLFSKEMFYFVMTLIGLSSGYTSTFMVLAVESFGTNLRATAACFITSLARCSIIGINAFIPWLSGMMLSMWLSFAYIGIFLFFVVCICLYFIKDTSNKSIDYLEKLVYKSA